MIRPELREKEDITNCLKKNGYCSLLVPEQKGDQFRQCQAWELDVEIDGNTCVALQSYNTLVAVIKDGVLYRDVYSRTTSKQITMWAQGYNVAREVKF